MRLIFAILRTEHFDIHYYPDARAAALDAARMAERSYGRLSRLLKHEYKERKPIILYASHSDFQQTNALGGESPSEGTGRRHRFSEAADDSPLHGLLR